MKRLLCVLLLSLTLLCNAFPGMLGSMAASPGYGFAPQSYKSGYTYGSGVYFAPYRFTLYAEPKESATVIGEFRWGQRNQSNTVDIIRPNVDHTTTYANRVFFCFYSDLNVAMMAVTGDTDNGWVEVIYDQEKRKTAWVKLKPEESKPVGSAKSDSKENTEPAHFGVYQTWLEFMKLNAKASGIYWLSGVSEYQRSVRTADDDGAKLISVTIIREMKVRHVRGNWLLVEVLDFERNMPIGWVRWRDDNGELMAFPNISGQHLPIVTTY